MPFLTAARTRHAIGFGLGDSGEQIGVRFFHRDFELGVQTAGFSLRFRRGIDGCNGGRSRDCRCHHCGNVYRFTGSGGHYGLDNHRDGNRSEDWIGFGDNDHRNFGKRNAYRGRGRYLSGHWFRPNRLIARRFHLGNNGWCFHESLGGLGYQWGNHFRRGWRRRGRGLFEHRLHRNFFPRFDQSIFIDPIFFGYDERLDLHKTLLVDHAGRGFHLNARVLEKLDQGVARNLIGLGERRDPFFAVNSHIFTFTSGQVPAGMVPEDFIFPTGPPSHWCGSTLQRDTNT